MTKPFLNGWFYLPYSKIKNLDSLKQELTVVSSFHKKGEPPKIIYMYDETTYNDFIGVPLRFGLDRFKTAFPNDWKERFDNLSSYGHPISEDVFKKCPDLNHAKASEAQKTIAPQILELLKQKQATILKAAVGAGKTVISLWIVSQLKVSTLILVKSNQLKEQWENEIEDKLGYPKSEIGLVQGKVCNIKPITIALVQTLWKGNNKDQLENQFGLVIPDEIHNLGAEKFVKCIGQTNAYYNLGLSATTERQDKCDEAYKHHFGPVETKVDTKALPMEVQPLNYYSYQKNWGKDRNSKIKCITLDSTRNKLLAQLIYLVAHKQGHQTLILGEYRDHLYKVFELAISLGLDPNVCGHFYGEGSKVDKLSVHADRSSDKNYFKWIKEEAQVIFSTRGMMKEGISINRLVRKIELTPRSESKQEDGRIRRPHPDKVMPKTYTILDKNEPLFKAYAKNRIKEYLVDKTLTILEEQDLQDYV